MSCTERTPEAALKAKGAYVGHLITLNLALAEEVTILDSRLDDDCFFVHFLVHLKADHCAAESSKDLKLMQRLYEYSLEDIDALLLAISYSRDTIALASQSKEMHHLLMNTELWSILWKIAEQTGVSVALSAFETNDAWQWDPRDDNGGKRTGH